MKVILKDNIEYLGKKGDIVKVAPGYGRNYLLPKKLALKVTATNMKMIEMVQKSLRKGLEKEMKVYLSLIEKLNAVALIFTRKAGEKDAIFGSVSVTDIREALVELGFDIEKKKILLDEPIKRLGNYTVPIKVFHDDRAEIKLEVAREGGPEEAEPSEPEATETLIAAEAEPMPETEAAPVAAETAVEPEAPVGPGEESSAPIEAQPEVSVAEAGLPEPVAETPEPEPVAETPEPEAEEKEPEPEPEVKTPEPTAETPEPEKTEDAPAGDKDTDEKP